MDSIEEIKKDFKALEERLNKLEKKDNKRWRAENGEEYWFVDDETLEAETEYGHEIDDFRYKTRNYFKTKEEAETYLDNINTYWDLVELAEELNNGEEIDWENGNQEKHYFYFCFNYKTIYVASVNTCKDMGTIYCLDKNFLEKAKERIGEDRLIRLFKEV